MNLTDSDVENALKIKERFSTRSNAQAVSTALAFTSQLVSLLKKNSKLLIEDENGQIQQVLLLGTLNDEQS